jgi:hypothetical protein
LPRLGEGAAEVHEDKTRFKPDRRFLKGRNRILEVAQFQEHASIVGQNFRRPGQLRDRFFVNRPRPFEIPLLNPQLRQTNPRIPLLRLDLQQSLIFRRRFIGTADLRKKRRRAQIRIGILGPKPARRAIRFDGLRHFS